MITSSASLFSRRRITVFQDIHHGVLKMGIAEIKREINDSLASDDTVVEETDLLRLQEWGFKYGASRCDHRPGRAGRVADQCGTGTISILTHGHLLG